MSLIERLEAAECGSRELDAEIAVITCWPALGRIKHWVHDERMEVRERGNIGFKDLPDNPAEWSSPEVTTSLDSALALAERALPLGSWVLKYARDGDYMATLYWTDDSFVSRCKVATAPTPALALCIAILKAKETK